MEWLAAHKDVNMRELNQNFESAAECLHSNRNPRGVGARLQVMEWLAAHIEKYHSRTLLEKYPFPDVAPSPKTLPAGAAAMAANASRSTPAVIPPEMLPRFKVAVELLFATKFANPADDRAKTVLDWLIKYPSVDPADLLEKFPFVAKLLFGREILPYSMADDRKKVVDWLVEHLELNPAALVPKFAPAIQLLYGRNDLPYSMADDRKKVVDWLVEHLELNPAALVPKFAPAIQLLYGRNDLPYSMADDRKKVVDWLVEHPNLKLADLLEKFPDASKLLFGRILGSDQHHVEKRFQVVEWQIDHLNVLHHDVSPTDFVANVEAIAHLRWRSEVVHKLKSLSDDEARARVASASRMIFVFSFQAGGPADEDRLAMPDGLLESMVAFLVESPAAGKEELVARFPCGQAAFAVLDNYADKLLPTLMKDDKQEDQRRRKTIEHMIRAMQDNDGHGGADDAFQFLLGESKLEEENAEDLKDLRERLAAQKAERERVSASLWD